MDDRTIAQRIESLKGDIFDKFEDIADLADTCRDNGWHGTADILMEAYHQSHKTWCKMADARDAAIALKV